MIDYNMKSLADLAELLLKYGESKNKAEDAAMQKVIDIDGKPYQWNKDDSCWEQIIPDIPADDLTPEAMKFFTLQGIVDYINLNTEKLIPEDGQKLILQVVNETTVCLLSQPQLHHKKRYVIARADAHVPIITFERYLDIDAFCTMLLSKFIDTEPRRQLFSVVKSMTKEQTANTTDDGVGQQITVKQGVSMASNVTFQNPVPLQPRRTFTEVVQPESNFTLRVDSNANSALFESDGGTWKNCAVENIRRFLIDHITNPSVVVIA